LDRKNEGQADGEGTVMLDHGTADMSGGPIAGLLRGTPVLTMQGAIPVEELAVGDRVVTRAGTLRLRAVEAHAVARARMVRIVDSALGKDRPEADIVIAEGQAVLVRDWRARALADADRAMIPAGRMIDGEYIRAETQRDAVFYALHFDVTAVVYACGLELACEPACVSA
jgi:hypothetical protein